MKQEEFDKLTNFPTLAKNFNVQSNTWHLLYNTKTRRPWVCSLVYSTINGLAKRLPRSEPWYVMTGTRNSFDQLLFPNNLKTATCYQWLFNPVTRVLDHQPLGLTLEEEFEHRLMVEKGAVLDRITGVVNSYRRPFQRNTLDQEYVHQEKAKEAEKILTNPSVDISEVPFVNDYAESLGIDIRVAAQEIIDKNRFQLSAYRESEKIRMQYSDAVYRETTFEGLNAITQEVKKLHKKYFRS